MSTETLPSIAFIGECMIELRTDDKANVCQSFAGDSLNTAVYLARLLPLNQHQIHFVTALGVDNFSNAMIDYFQSEGIICDKIRRLPGRQPGLYYINIDSAGERYFQYWRDQSAARYLFSGHEYNHELHSLVNMDYLYCSGISIAILSDPDRQKLIDLLAHAKTQGTKICFDSNYRPVLWDNVDQAHYWYQQMLAMTDIAFLTYDDEYELWGDNSPEHVFSRCKVFDIAEIILKRGAQPCLIKTATTTYTVDTVSIPADQIVDTTAAGDSFSAGYLARRLQGENCPKACAAIGHKLASIVVQYQGAIVSQNIVSQGF
jgi:2-dehydro-3-deoxygluconokinase